MRKVYISFNSAPAIEKNANEYSVYPKTNTFPAEFDGNSITAAFTSGKGKSAIPNYYLYFRDEKNSIFYFRSNPEEIENAKKGFAIYSKEGIAEIEALPADEETELDEAESAAIAELAPSAPAKARRSRRGG